MVTRIPSLKYQAIIEEPFRSHILELYETFYGNTDVLTIAVHRINRSVIHTTVHFDKILARRLTDEKKLSFVLDCNLPEMVKAGYIIIYSVSPHLILDMQPSLQEYIDYSKKMCYVLWQKCNTSYEAASFYILSLVVQNLVALYATRRTGIICTDLHTVPIAQANMYLPEQLTVYELSLISQALEQPINGTYMSNAFYKKLHRKVKVCVENL